MNSSSVVLLKRNVCKGRCGGRLRDESLETDQLTLCHEKVFQDCVLHRAVQVYSPDSLSCMSLGNGRESTKHRCLWKSERQVEPVLGCLQQQRDVVPEAPGLGSQGEERLPD